MKKNTQWRSYRRVSHYFLYKALKYLTKDMYTHKNSPGFCTDLPHSNWEFFSFLFFFASFRKLYLDSFAKLRKNTTCFDSANYLTNRWHFDITVTQDEDLERNYIKFFCFVTWSTPVQMFFDMFSGAWGSFNLKMEIHELKYKLQSRSLEVFKHSKESESE